MVAQLVRAFASHKITFRLPPRATINAGRCNGFVSFLPGKRAWIRERSRVRNPHREENHILGLGLSETVHQPTHQLFHYTDLRKEYRWPFRGSRGVHSDPPCRVHSSMKVEKSSKGVEIRTVALASFTPLSSIEYQSCDISF